MHKRNEMVGDLEKRMGQLGLRIGNLEFIIEKLSEPLI
jgi:hypothetical protein